MQPIQSFLGGVGLAIPTHALLLLNGNIFGISGFLHRAVHGNADSLASLAGLIAGGVFVGLISGQVPASNQVTWPTLLLSGALSGAGTKLSHGCTSGHMIAGISRFSLRSITATAVFFATSVVTSALFGAHLPSPSPEWNWGLDQVGGSLILTQIAIAGSLVVLPLIMHHHAESSNRLRRTAAFLTAFGFALGLRVSGLSDPVKVLGFLSLPYNKAFDPSLAFLALGALPLSVTLYQFFRGRESPALGGPWAVPKRGEIDPKLVIGAATFGVGWGISGVCPGSALVNLGWSLATAQEKSLELGSWILAFIMGGIFF